MGNNQVMCQKTKQHQLISEDRGLTYSISIHTYIGIMFSSKTLSLASCPHLLNNDVIQSTKEMNSKGRMKVEVEAGR